VGTVFVYKLRISAAVKSLLERRMGTTNCPSLLVLTDGPSVYLSDAIRIARGGVSWRRSSSASAGSDEIVDRTDCSIYQLTFRPDVSVSITRDLRQNVNA
jgi:hypothetical protein